MLGASNPCPRETTQRTRTNAHAHAPPHTHQRTRTNAHAHSHAHICTRVDTRIPHTTETLPTIARRDGRYRPGLVETEHGDVFVYHHSLAAKGTSHSLTF